MEPVTTRQLNRWTLARQHLLERAGGLKGASGAGGLDSASGAGGLDPASGAGGLDSASGAGGLDPAAAVEALAGMQAQAPSAPYLGLWSRLAGFQVADLEAALHARTVVKTTVMRGTLHLVARSRLAAFRLATGSGYYDGTFRLLAGLGLDLDAIRARVAAQVEERTRSRTEVYRLVAEQIPVPHPPWVADRPSAVAALSVTTDLVNAPEDALYGAPAKSRYEVLRTEEPSPLEAARQVASDYLAAYGPATTADLAAWSGRPARTFADGLASLDLVRFRAEDGRTLLDLADAPRPDGDIPAPVRFLGQPPLGPRPPRAGAGRRAPQAGDRQERRRGPDVPGGRRRRRNLERPAPDGAADAHPATARAPGPVGAASGRRGGSAPPGLVAARGGRGAHRLGLTPFGRPSAGVRRPLLIQP